MFVRSVCEVSIWQHVTTECTLMSQSFVNLACYIWISNSVYFQVQILKGMTAIMLNTRGRGILEGHVDQKDCLCFPLLAFLLLPAWPYWSPEISLQTIPWQRNAALWGSTAPRARGLLSPGPGTLHISPHVPSHWGCSTLTTAVVQWLCLGTTVLPKIFLQYKDLSCLQFPEWWRIMQPSTEGDWKRAPCVRSTDFELGHHMW